MYAPMRKCYRLTSKSYMCRQTLTRRVWIGVCKPSENQSRFRYFKFRFHKRLYYLHLQIFFTFLPGRARSPSPLAVSIVLLLFAKYSLNISLQIMSVYLSFFMHAPMRKCYRLASKSYMYISWAPLENFVWRGSSNKERLEEVFKPNENQTIKVYIL